MDARAPCSGWLVLVPGLYVGRDPCHAPGHAPSHASCTFSSVTNPACPAQTVCARGPGQDRGIFCRNVESNAWCYAAF